MYYEGGTTKGVSDTTSLHEEIVDGAYAVTSRGQLVFRVASQDLMNHD